MAQHLILGEGNLGRDIDDVLTEKNGSVNVHRWGHGTFDWPQRPPRGLEQFDYIWCAIGWGSVPEAAQNFAHAFDVHVNLPLHIVQAAPKSKLIFFSSDYVEANAASLYALSKYFMEHTLAFHMNWAGMRNINIVRVGSLYGKHRPHKNLAHKIQQNPATIVNLPINEIRPTPTRWVAEFLADRIDGLPPLFHLCPNDMITVAEFGRTVTDRKIEAGMLDIQRPRVIEPRCSYWKDAPGWKELWDKYGK